jgi:prepilin-type N-terminal cleavage/methylation domain-containing protein
MVSRRSGFTLAEVIVAMTLLSVCALGVAATALVAVQSFTRAELQQRVFQEAELVLDSLLALPANAAGSMITHSANVSWTASDSTGAITVSVLLPHRGRIDLIGQR